MDTNFVYRMFFILDEGGAFVFPVLCLKPCRFPRAHVPQLKLKQGKTFEKTGFIIICFFFAFLAIVDMSSQEPIVGSWSSFFFFFFFFLKPFGREIRHTRPQRPRSFYSAPCQEFYRGCAEQPFLILSQSEYQT